MIKTDVIVIGAGAAGLFCAAQLGQKGKQVIVLEKANKVGKKILMSGGGRCNFTNLNIEPSCYLSQNPHFCKSALSRYNQWHFIDLVNQYGIDYYEKTLGQLFCVGKSKEIVDMLLAECAKGSVTIKTKQSVSKIVKLEAGFKVTVDNTTYLANSCVIASGGLSIPTLGGSAFGYELAKQFGHRIMPTRAGLVPLTYHAQDKQKLAELSGISVNTTISTDKQSFTEAMLFTHRGLSGPAVLQISSYWQPGQPLNIQFLPELDLDGSYQQILNDAPNKSVKNWLSMHMPKRMVELILPQSLLQHSVSSLTKDLLEILQAKLQHWSFYPNGTEGYRTAEVTLGGVDVNQVSSKTFESTLQAGLYFIGEVLDVTGWLGGYNFQWAWSSAHACSEAITAAH